MRNDGSVDYHRLDRPAVLRQKAAAFNQTNNVNPANPVAARPKQAMNTPPIAAPAAAPEIQQPKRSAADYLDITAFLRRPEEVE